MNDLAKKLNITKDDYQGQTFEGNACKTILANTDNMRIFLEVHDKEEFVPFIDTLEAFEEVVQTCFGFEYNEQYEEKIELFEKRWMHLKEEFRITVPNKCHIIFTHVKDFIFAHKMSLGILSEQVVQACHSKWIKLWESSYKIRNLDSELYGVGMTNPIKF